ncbi:nuclear transport factor 2 family protein [Tunicatimonas pelagia]|uniref:nuclear transport factor 2 family protein n=1 Tax=Tunicatimonas pelagia TaxID=931531 RepID=UPI002665EBE4|nr:nuclear transport factor 2 family protein [Tunicatimonas pelagia]WKN44820.1 nuclear transport factor 2 family protein [Tunicatimonas pelagia]
MTLSEKEKIVQLTARYFWAVDEGDIETYLDCWTADGESQASYGSAQGAAELKIRFLSMQEGLSKNKRHIVSNFVIEFEQEVALQKCYLLIIDRKKPALVATATYQDTLVRTADGWKFSLRKITVDPNWQHHELTKKSFIQNK